MNRVVGETQRPLQRIDAGPARRAAVGAFVVVVTLAAIVFPAALFLDNRGFLKTGAVLYAGRAVHLVLFAALSWAAYFLGRLITRGVFRLRDGRWEIDLALGYYAFGMLALFLAAAHLLYPWVVRGVVLALLLLSAPTWRRLSRGAGDFLRERWGDLTPGVQLLAAAAVPLVAACLPCAALPPFQWDALVYHLFLPKLYVGAHGLVYLPRMVYASMPLGADMIFTWAYGWDGLGAAAAVAPLINCLMVVATWRLARRYLDNFWATAAAIFLLFTPVFAYLLNIAYVDFVQGAFAVMALWLYLGGFERGREAAFAGVLLGAALGVKYTGVNALVAFLPLAALDLARRRLALKHAAIFFGAALLVFAPWPIKTFIERGNPFFPVFYDVFGGRGISAEVAHGIVRAMRVVGMGRAPSDYLLLPYRVSVEGGIGFAYFDGTVWPFTFLILPLALLWFRCWRLWLFTAAYFAAWAVVGSQQIRFFGGGLATTAVLMAGLGAAAADSFRGGLRTAARGVIVALVLAFGYFINFGQVVSCVQWLSQYAVEDGDRFLTRVARAYAADKFVNRELPPDARVLMVFDNTLLYVDRPAVYDSFGEAAQLFLAVRKMNTAGEVATYVDGLGVTYILTNNMAAEYFWKYYDRTTRDLWQLYLSEYTAVVYRDANCDVRVINRPGGVSP